MQKLLLLGVEAIAQGAIDGGLSGVYAYPGTPSTEITEYVQKSKEAAEKNIHKDWSANEKTALEAGLGMAYAGKRAMVCMKHVGLNVAADPFINSAVTGVNGGLLVVVADDPSMHSSQNEQDSRYYGRFAQIPVLEPSNQQEAYDMAYHSFELSEKFGLPILMRLTTRLAHSRTGIEQLPVKPQNETSLPKDPKQFILLPVIARRRYKLLLEAQEAILEAANNSKYNKYIEGADKSMGIITGGIGYNYLMENYSETDCPYPVVKVSQYPLPKKHIERLFGECEKILVLEDGYPIIEEIVKDYLESCTKVHGRLDGTLPRDGELNPDIVAAALGLEVKTGEDTPEFVTNRPPALCIGCSHIDVYKALNESIEQYGKGRVFADIGCYTLGALPPFNAIDSCVDMGASITMAKGAADAGLVPAACVIGDSTFTHSGMSGLLDAVIEKSPITVIISDNEATAMTGGQNSSAFGRIEAICEGIGVEKEHIRIINPVKKNHDELVKIMKEELAYNGVSVIIPRRPCIQKLSRDKKKKRAAKK